MFVLFTNSVFLRDVCFFSIMKPNEGVDALT